MTLLAAGRALGPLDGRSRPTRTRLTEFEARQDPGSFLRCHRNYIVNVDQVQRWRQRDKPPRPRPRLA